MTIDQVRDAAIRAEPVRRLVEVAPSADELRSAIDEGLDVLGEGIGMVAERVDHSAGLIRDRVSVPDQLTTIPDRLAVQLGIRRPPPRVVVPRPVVLLLGLVAIVAAAAVVSRLWGDRLMRVRDRLMPRISDAMDGVMGTRRSTGPMAGRDIDDDALAQRARSALGQSRNLATIHIEVERGVVRAEGRIDPDDRAHALATLRAVPGVIGVEDRLTVQPSDPLEGSITETEGAGVAESGLPMGSIEVRP